LLNGLKKVVALPGQAEYTSGIGWNAIRPHHLSFNETCLLHDLDVTGDCSAVVALNV
jgi:hypothetical protein